MSLYLKWTAKGRVPPIQGGKPIPVNRWTARVAKPVICESGWHACRWEDVSAHIAAELWVCELDGQIVEGPDKVVAERLRLVERVPISDQQFRLFAADCAEMVLHHFEDRHPGDDRPRKAIEVARAFANGTATADELTAAWSAAWSAARSAAWSAASAARSAAGSAAGSAESAAWSAAWSAARSAAWSAQSDPMLNRLGLDPTRFAHRTVAE